MKTIKIHVFEDPAHGWAKVKKSLLEKLGIEKEITGYSYMRGEYAYLEEDQDLTTLVNKLKELGYVIVYKTTISNSSSKIRSYDHYKVMTTEETARYEQIRKTLLNLKNWNKKGIRKIQNGTMLDLDYWNKEYNLGL